MKARVKRLWMGALRSGDYEQGKFQLARVGEDGITRYCCLGVLCDLAVKEGVIDEPVLNSGSWEFPDPMPGNPRFKNSGTLPWQVQEWAGLDDPNPHIGKGSTDTFDYQIRASYANDEYGWDFMRISDAIETHVPEDEVEDASRDA